MPLTLQQQQRCLRPLLLLVVPGPRPHPDTATTRPDPCAVLTSPGYFHAEKPQHAPSLTAAWEKRQARRRFQVLTIYK